MKFKRTLYYKFIFTYLAFAIFGMIILYISGSYMLRRQLISTEAVSLYREASMLSSRYATQIYNGNTTPEEAREELYAIDTYLNCPIWLIDRDGQVIINTRKVYERGETQVVEDFDPADSKSYYITGDFYGCFQEEMLSVFVPINRDFQVRGYIVVFMPMRTVLKSSSDIMGIILKSYIMLIVLSLSILIVFTFEVYKPLNKIIKGAEEYAKGNYDYDTSVKKSGEIGYLADTLNYMASEIARSDDNQKKFIANVSHDFKSPLTSIQGYLEAMLDGTIPMEMHEKYIGRVLNETRRLTKLTASLLQLNNLNIKGLVLEFKEFDINKTIKQTCETFEGRCLEQRITLELVLTGEDFYVKADEGKIEQVLYNLIDNAIKFSHKDSVIKIETTEKNDKLFVSVKDSGIGIPKDGVAHVFERFYKSDLSRGKDKKGTGLGLAIVKEIINAHEENINVVSTEGVGTEFIFTLRSAGR